MGGADRFFVDDVVLIGAYIVKDGFEEKPEFVAWERVRKNQGRSGDSHHDADLLLSP
jgi:hypothetical protein